MRHFTTIHRLASTGIDWADWYRQAGSDIRARAKSENWNWKRYADCLAIASPRVQVTRSIAIAEHFMRTDTAPSGTLAMTAKRLEAYQRDRVVRGYKCQQFARALKGDSRAVVLDVWMARALGVDQQYFDHRPDRPTNIAIIQRCTDKVIAIANRLKLTPCAAQAAIWAGTMLEHGRNPARLNLA